ncbi:F0F1 ATP synthase subunit B [Georgenia yuyongxinii]|uniref:ATP synthase subunit b n=1 Tax=Georgenia yuyongxinii TaxID=2589797 RepID=A0A5B8CBE4_9MICO|nr:F0F1 ATP synthase subunit B [Georgenia yuyongxinii]QDC25476.1 F0F1 ATP synthase subunit B [Georgenia yuyongxinii]
MNANAPVVAQEVTTQNPLLPAGYDILWSAVCIAIIAFFLVKYAVPRLTAMLDERAAKIEAGLAQAEKAQRAAADAEERIASELADARREAAGVREQAQEEGKRIVAEARGKAQTEADRVTEAAQRQIEADRQAAQISLRTDVGMLATELASRIVGESVTEQALQSRVIDRFLDQLEAAEAEQGAAATTREA